MIYFLIAIVAVLFCSLFVFYAQRKKRLSTECEQKIHNFQNQMSEFFTEYAGLIRQYIPKETEYEFIAKWQRLYAEIQRIHIPKNHNAFVEITQFKKTYKNLHTLISTVNAEIKRKEKLHLLSQKITAFFDELFNMTHQYVVHSMEEQYAQKWRWLFQEAKDADIRADDAEMSEIKYFILTYSSLHDYISVANDRFIKTESAKYDHIFSNIDGKSLDEQQRTAVITDEDRILVLAGAGSGKTLTIAAKVKYLCEVKNIRPQNILLVSFTKKAAQEMTERIQVRLGIPVEATTFHKLGLNIIATSDGKRPDVSDENALNQFVHTFFENELLNHPYLVENLTKYFAYFLEIPNNMEQYASLGELYEEEKLADLETLKSKYDRETYIRETGVEKAKSFITLNNEYVKSREETQIANFLFMHGINYEYERPYPFESDDPFRKSYCPDFYLSDYDIYLEHFGIAKDGSLPWLSSVEEKKYLDSIAWKRTFHREHGTRLIETYSWYNTEGILLKKLEELLIENGVVYKPRDFMDIFNTVYASKSNKYCSEFIQLCCTFITLFKSNNYKIAQIETIRQNYLSEETNDFLRERTSLFLDIIKIILAEYQNYLSANGTIDFSDMINHATERIVSGAEIPPYQYVIVDEYQDISQARFHFLKAIADRTGAKLFCVGDDWQSIYRFAGSDISLFTDFEKQFGYTKILKIEKTYRNSQNLIDEASRFILKNPLQLKKNVRSEKFLDYPLVFWGFDDDPKQALHLIIQKSIADFGIQSSVLLLGRTNYDIEIVKKSGLFRTINANRTERLQYIPAPQLDIDFLSVHKAKGLEADTVILLNFKNDRLGFPNQIADDRLLQLVLAKAEDFTFAEERRLFYVALTRTKNRIFILTDNRNPSPFFKEFSESKSVCFVSIKQTNSENQSLCPLCKTGSLLKIEHKGEAFVGCSHFPMCRYTLPDPTILLNPKKCPSCGGFLIKRKGKNGHRFVGCTNYPYCKYTEQLETNGMG